MQPAGQRAPRGLDPLDFPLRGSQLIEASAGTGKTWTIAALYLRLVLGHGPLSTPARLPAEILVLTFTEAASQELRDRIRSRLAEGARFFSQDSSQSGDPFLVDLRASYPESAWPACARVLDLAAQSMDEAAISTIHAWCARMLQEHAFDSGSLFTQSLEADLQQLEREAVWDYWRSFCVNLTISDTAQVQSWWKGPGALYGAIRDQLHKDTGLVPGVDGPAQLLDQARLQAQAVLTELKSSWRVYVEELSDILALHGKDIAIRPSDQKRWLGAVRDWANDPDALSLDIKTGWERLSQAGIDAAWKGEGLAPEHPAFIALTRLREALAHLPDGYAQVWSHALAWCVERLRESLAQRAQMGFDGLLTNLDAALGGPSGERLARVLRAQYPVVLIDEFQDTDPVQYRIFDRIYEIADNRKDLCLVLIGDPKQAIYGFRGADIHAYLQARRACASRLHTLNRNYRSSQMMVGAVNACFEQAEAKREEGAFLAPGQGSRDIPFFPVQAHGRDDVWVIDGAVQAALAFCEIQSEDGSALTVSSYQEQSAQQCADQVTQVLNLGQQGRAGFDGADGFRAVRPADIAILVNSHNEAATLRSALSARQVRSVYLSERESVYDSAEAAELQYWLAACVQPTDGRAVRTALASATLGLTWVDIERINTDERAWEDMVLRFQSYRECWQQRGVLPMLRRLLNDFGVPARLLGALDGAQGERVLTNILHLAELLQRASGQLDGEQALIRYLAEQRSDSQARALGGGDAQQIRLESDANLVRVVTVHKSKGLEYPLVFLPFACKARMYRRSDKPLVLPDEQGRRTLIFTPSSAHIEQAERERLAEDVRKLYVALTRARYAVWMTAGELRQVSDNSAATYVLGVDGSIAASMRKLALKHPEITVLDAAEPGAQGFESSAAPQALGVARVPVRAVREPWWISSYSALRVTEADGRAWHVADTAAEDVFRETRLEDTSTSQGVDAGLAHPEDLSLHYFPRGSEAGTFLHALLEWAARQGFARLKTEPASLRDMVARRCALRGWEPWIDFLCDWLLRCVQTVLVPDAAVCSGLRLDALQASSPEMEFWLSVSQVDVQQLDARVCRETFGGAPRPHLAPMRLDGMFKGFLDLVLLHEGRYYVVDYKSNWLGPNDAAYTQEAMRQTMLGARYDMQLVLYVLALHRQLRARLADYDYDQHMGGALYLFLRGLDAPGQGIFADRPARGLIEALDSLYAGTGDGVVHE
ncbi:exodeoxyribonuclease V subunit beta [Alcaligenaceae bacterium CGII-47]|nr:exodeoxyribonuclease V subunit beta [Alcaligenaceae bacterium CGII-47]